MSEPHPHKLVLEFNGAEMVRIHDASKAEGLSMEVWAAAIVAIAAAEFARLQRLKAVSDDSQVTGEG